MNQDAESVLRGGAGISGVLGRRFARAIKGFTRHEC